MGPLLVLSPSQGGPGSNRNKGVNSHLPRAPEMEPHQMQFSVIPETFNFFFVSGVLFPLYRIQLAYSKSC